MADKHTKQLGTVILNKNVNNIYINVNIANKALRRSVHSIKDWKLARLLRIRKKRLLNGKIKMEKAL